MVGVIAGVRVTYFLCDTLSMVGVIAGFRALIFLYAALYHVNFMAFCPGFRIGLSN